MKYKLTRHTRFNFAIGQDEEWFSLWAYVATFFGKRKWKRVTEYNVIGVKLPVTGDFAWAVRISKHLQISLPPGTKEF